MKHARDKHKGTAPDSRAKRRSSAETGGQPSLEERRERMQSVQARRAREEESRRARTTAPAKKKKTGRANSKRKSKLASSLVWARLRVGLVILVCVGAVIGLGVGAGMYAAISNEVGEMDFESMAYNFSSVVFANDKNGNSVEVEYLHNDGNRQWIDSEFIPEIAKEAAISIEDERFYKHKGVDLKRTTGAVIGWIGAKLTGKSPSYGGSTITQQVMKNITNEKDRTAIRKIKEMMRATALEKNFTKDEILTLYLNIVYFGNQCYGIEAASKMYFSKSAIDLTLPEAAMIVGITQAPSRYDPFKHPEDTVKKRNTVITKMYELDKITEEEYNEAINSPLGVNDRKNSLNSSVYSYFVDQVINDVIADLQAQKGYSQAFATQQIFSGGLKIYTTMDSDIQAAMESVYTNTANFAGASKAQSAMVIIDPYTGQIKGMVGGIGTKNESRGLNRATQSFRQPGSAVKPLSVYSPALESKKITAATILTDEPITIGEWSPKNSYSGFKGDMSVRKAIEISANIPAVKTLQTSGISTSYDFMTNKFHFTSLSENDKNLSALGLGGMTKGVSPKEMAAAYSVFPNKGVYITPHTYTKVLDSAGKVLLENKPKSTRVLSEANAYIMSSFLREVVNGSAGTGARARLSNFTTYGKTGTSNDSKDKWFCGFTAHYVGAVWCGFDQNNGSISSSVPNVVWKTVMEKVHQGLGAKSIPQPDSVTAVSLCQRTGKLSSGGCTLAKTEYFARGTVPTKYCENIHPAAGGTADPDASPSPSPTAEASASPDPSETPIVVSPKPSNEPVTQRPTANPTKEPTKAPVQDDIITLE